MGGRIKNIVIPKNLVRERYREIENEKEGE